MIKILMMAAAAMIAAAAQAVPRHTTGTDWFYEGGYFHKDQGAETWTETVGDAVQYRFVETARTNFEADLYDAGRDLAVLLNENAMYLKRQGETESLSRNGRMLGADRSGNRSLRRVNEDFRDGRQRRRRPFIDRL